MSSAVAILDKLLTALFTTTDLLDTTDTVGAFPDHAINVSNRAESLRLMEQVYALRPTLLQRAHVNDVVNFPLFSHETSLHIYVVNKREKECIQSLKIATDRLSRSDVAELLGHQCTGQFFQNKPMCGYGGHVMAFAAGFGQIAVCAACVALGHREWKDWRCELTGYLPIHVATVRNQGEMVDWLVANFGVEQLSAEVAGFTPLLLATRLGHQKLVRRLLKHDNEIRWVWGDIKQCRLRLQPTLDSHVSEGFTTVMRLLGRYDASERTQEMLLDSFLGGKLFGLVEEKWQRQARLWFWTSTIVLLAYAVLVTYVASPSMLGRTRHSDASLVATSVGTLLTAAVLLEEELREMLLWLRHNGPLQEVIRNAPAHFRSDVSFATSWVALWQLAVERYSPFRLTSLLCAMPACVALLHHPELVHAEWVRVMLALAAFAAWLLVFFQLFVPSRELGVFAVVVKKMLFSDVASFMTVYLPILFGFAAAMHALGSSTHTRWAHWWSACENLLMMSFAGGDLNMGEWDEPGKYLDTSAFELSYLSAVLLYVLYLGFLLMSTVLMLNLLIAMMSSTYELTLSQAVLAWRVLFLRMVLRMELLSPLALQTTHLGQASEDGSAPFLEYRVSTEEPASDPFHSDESDAAAATNRFEMLARALEKQRSTAAHVAAIQASLVTLQQSVARIEAATSATSVGGVARARESSKEAVHDDASA